MTKAAMLYMCITEAAHMHIIQFCSWVHLVARGQLVDRGVQHRFMHVRNMQQGTHAQQKIVLGVNKPMRV